LDEQRKTENEHRISMLEHRKALSKEDIAKSRRDFIAEIYPNSGK
jgi:hypothetical protein